MAITITNYGTPIVNVNHKYTCVDLQVTVTEAAEMEAGFAINDGIVLPIFTDTVWYDGNRYTTMVNDQIQIGLNALTDGSGSFAIPPQEIEVLAPYTIVGTQVTFYWRVYFGSLWSANEMIWLCCLQKFVTQELPNVTLLGFIAFANAYQNGNVIYTNNMTYSEDAWTFRNVNVSNPIQQAQGALYTDISLEYLTPNNQLYVATATADKYVIPQVKSANDTDLLISSSIISSSVSVDNDTLVHSVTIRAILDNNAELYDPDSELSIILALNKWLTKAKGDYVLATHTEIITFTLATYPVWNLSGITTDYWRGNINISGFVLDIVTSELTIQAQVEMNDPTILTYKLTDVNDNTHYYIGNQNWQSSSEVTDPEQGAMNRNVINVDFLSVAAGTYTLEASIVYDGQIYTDSIQIIVNERTLSYYGIVPRQYGNTPDKPITLSFGTTTGATIDKANYIRMTMVCAETGKSMTIAGEVYNYGTPTVIDIRPILPSVYLADNIEGYTINIDAILYDASLTYKGTCVGTQIVYVTSPCYINRDLASCVGYCARKTSRMTPLIIPQILEPKLGVTPKVWLSVFVNGLVVRKGTTNWKTFNYTHMQRYNYVTYCEEIDVNAEYNYNNWEYKCIPIIRSEGERMLVHIDNDNLNDNVPMFEMEVVSNVYESDNLDNIEMYQASMAANFNNGKYRYMRRETANVITLRIPNLNSASCWYWGIMLGALRSVIITNTPNNTSTYERYLCAGLTIKKSTQNLDNGSVTLKVKKYTTKYMLR